MSCRDWAIEIVECIRSGSDLPPAVMAHVGGCAGCREHLESEQALQPSVIGLRRAVAYERSPEQRRLELMREFDRVQRRPGSRPARWAFAAAAAVLFLFALRLTRTGESIHGPAGQIALSLADDRLIGGEFDSLSDDGDFVAVPYAPALASGEFVKVVRTRLYAAALDRMGVSVPVGNGEFPAEVMVGEDGLPRAVRVLEAYQD